MENQNRRFSAAAVIIGILILAGAIVFVFLLMQGTKTEADVVFQDNTIEITGQYGRVYNISDISKVQLADSIPAVGRKVDGAGLGDIKKGFFEVESLGKCRLFIQAAGGPYILMTTSEGNVILNFKDTERTKSVYKTLTEKTG